jgi:N utilization substance protein B
MTVPKQKFRELQLLLLFSHDIGGLSEEELPHLVMDTLKVTKKTVKEASLKVVDLLQKLEKIDCQIDMICSNYALDRIQKVEKNILRLALYEMLFDDLPYKVAICEGMRLARKFSTDESSSFINAVLDSIYKTINGEAVDKDKLKVAADNFLESQEVAKEAAENDSSEIKTEDTTNE